ncbi:MAG: hypothetical protein GXP55_00005, partial [Deltaproteobacteria bacterium]|nr:hypothetical protein [Deltaproteobacteria bacterium]
AVILALLQSARLRWLRARPSRRARKRLRKALRGERDAERLLEARGFVIEARQQRAELTLRVDGEQVSAGVRADLIVRRGDVRYVAEVKTGKLAPRVDHAATRRQLLEYALVFDVDGVLLVEPEADLVREVEFPALTRRAPPGSASAQMLVGWLIAAALGAAMACWVLA